MATAQVANTTAGVEGKELLLADGSPQTVSKQITYDLGGGAPFICVAGAAVVDHLDADMVDGEDAADFHDATQLSGLVPTANLGTGTANRGTFLTGDQKFGLAHGLDIVNGRLTLTTAVPVTTADVTAAGTLYFTPYKGNRIALYTGTVWVVLSIAELSIAVPAVANQCYDVFVDYNAGVPALVLVAWANDTTRATALTLQDGVLVKTGATGQRYVGTVRTKTASQLNDSLLFRHVWNYYNRIWRDLKVFEATNSWAYTSAAAYQQANASAANQIDFVIGVQEDKVRARLSAMYANDAGGTSASASIGLDSVTTPSTDVLGGVCGANGAGIPQQILAEYEGFTGIGRHLLTWLERGAGGGTTTWYGDTFSTYSINGGLRGAILG